MIIIPLMLYHQFQLMASAWIATAWAKGADEESAISVDAAPETQHQG
jgi:predicted Na+-dependent transporter